MESAVIRQHSVIMKYLEKKSKASKSNEWQMVNSSCELCHDPTHSGWRLDVLCILKHKSCSSVLENDIFLVDVCCTMTTVAILKLVPCDGAGLETTLTSRCCYTIIPLSDVPAHIKGYMFESLNSASEQTLPLFRHHNHFKLTISSLKYISD